MFRFFVRPFARKGLNMRAALVGALAAQRHRSQSVEQKSAARHFIIPRSKISVPEEFYNFGYTPLYTTLTGEIADVKQVVSPISLPKNRNRYVSTVPSVREYFDRPAPLVSICLRRAIRRQVLFAKRLTRKGSLKHRHKWSSDSLVRCLWHGNQLLPPSMSIR